MEKCALGKMYLLYNFMVLDTYIFLNLKMFLLSSVLFISGIPIMELSLITKSNKSNKQNSSEERKK